MRFILMITIEETSKKNIILENIIKSSKYSEELVEEILYKYIPVINQAQKKSIFKRKHPIIYKVTTPWKSKRVQDLNLEWIFLNLRKEFDLYFDCEDESFFTEKYYNDEKLKINNDIFFFKMVMYRSNLDDENIIEFDFFDECYGKINSISINILELDIQNILKLLSKIFTELILEKVNYLYQSLQKSVKLQDILCFKTSSLFTDGIDLFELELFGDDEFIEYKFKEFNNKYDFLNNVLVYFNKNLMSKTFEEKYFYINFIYKMCNKYKFIFIDFSEKIQDKLTDKDYFLMKAMNIELYLKFLHFRGFKEF